MLAARERERGGGEKVHNSLRLVSVRAEERPENLRLRENYKGPWRASLVCEVE